MTRGVAPAAEVWRRVACAGVLLLAVALAACSTAAVPALVVQPVDTAADSLDAADAQPDPGAAQDMQALDAPPAAADAVSDQAAPDVPVAADLLPEDAPEVAQADAPADTSVADVAAADVADAVDAVAAELSDSEADLGVADLTDAQPDAAPDLAAPDLAAEEAAADAADVTDVLAPADVSYVPAELLALPTAPFEDVTADFGLPNSNLKLNQAAPYAFCTIGADLDNDGRDDLLVVEAVAGQLAAHAVLLKAEAKIHVKSPFYGTPQFGDTGCAAADLDGDGLLDVLYGTPAGFVYLHNEGAGVFADQTTAMLPPIMDFSACSAAWADFDGDGSNELLVGAGGFYGQCNDMACQYTADDFYCASKAKLTADASMQDRMFVRNGAKFADATAAWKLPPGGWLTEVTAVDLDQDGKMDALVGNDKSDHYFLHNEPGGFKKYATDIGFLGYAHHMGWGIGDLDGDGLLDVMMGDAGPLPLYRQQPAPVGLPISFTNSSVAWGLAQVTHDVSAWNPLLVDFDQDGWLDVYLGIAAIAPGGALVNLAMCQPKILVPQHDLFLRNQGGKGFEAFKTAIPFPQTSDFVGVAQTAVDIDDDGDLDIVQVRRGGNVRVLRNDLAQPGTSVLVRLVGKPGNTYAIGARLTAQISGKNVVRQMIGDSGFGGNGQWRVHFGLGAAAQIDVLTVIWPDGKQTKVQAIAAGSKLNLTAP